MNLADLNLDVENEAEETRDFEPLPEGTYVAVVTEAEIRDTKAGDGTLLSLRCEVIEGDYARRLIFDNFNIVNKNPTAEKIGRSRLAALCKAVGINNPQEVEELIGKPFSAKVAIDTRQDKPRNVLKSFGPADSKQASAPKPAAAEPAKASAPAAGGKKPWQR